MKRLLVLTGIAAILFLATNAKAWVVQAAQLPSYLYDGGTPVAATATPQPQSTATTPAPSGYGSGLPCCGPFGRGMGMMGGMMGGARMTEGQRGRMGGMFGGMMAEISGMIQGQMGAMANSTSGMPHETMMTGIAPVHEDVAMMLGMTTQDLYTKMASGMSLVQIAAEKSVTEQQLMDGIIAGRKTAYGQAVTQGYMTQVQADAMLQHMQGNLKTMVNGQNYGSNGWGMMWEWEWGTQPTPQATP